MSEKDVGLDPNDLFSDETHFDDEPFSDETHLNDEPFAPPDAPATEEDPSRPSPFEVRLKEVESRVDDLDRVRTPAKPRVVFTCHYCGTSEERDMVDRPTAWAEVLQGVRDEIRTCALLDAPHAQRHAPPFDQQCEREVAAGALLGLNPPYASRLKRAHFWSPFFGRVWEFARAHFPRPNLEQVAMDFEKAHLGRADVVLPELEMLAGPYVAARADEGSYQRVIDLAWQRDMLYDTLAIAGFLGQDMGVDVDDLRQRILALRDKLKRGPG
jgi:hypothetical protein